MFDTIVPMSDDTRRFRCAAGHQVTDLQTKDLSQSLDVYAIVDGVIRGPNASDGEWASARELDFSGELVVYDLCGECEPLYGLGRSRDGREFVQTFEPWCEFAVTVERGRVERVEPLRLQTREDLAGNLSAWTLLASDDPRVLEERKRRAGELGL